MRIVGGKLIKGTGYGVEEVDKGIKEIGSGFPKLGRKTKPQRKVVGITTLSFLISGMIQNSGQQVQKALAESYDTFS